ncbi:MAG: hypothetical protein JSS78_11300 [Bacteroidetes bacterium]|nr:hypothetical protein [Bacteroidota bacterium]
MADAISKAIGKPVVYKSLSMEEMRTRMEKQGIPTKSIDSLLALAAYQKAGGATEKTSDSVQKILNRSPYSVEQFASDYQEYFIG